MTAQDFSNEFTSLFLLIICPLFSHQGNGTEDSEKEASGGIAGKKATQHPFRDIG